MKGGYHLEQNDCGIEYIDFKQFFADKLANLHVLYI